MVWIRQLVEHTDLALGLLLSVVLGSVVGVTLSHPLGHLLFSSALGVAFLLIYAAGFALGAIWMMGVQQGLVVLSAFVWCVLLGLWLTPHPEVSSVVNLF
jgi:hypothetical protein